MEQGTHQPTLSVPAAARRLGISRSKAYQLVQDGRIASIRIDRRIVVLRDALDAFVSQNTRGAATV